jgi:hypothetical protein
MDRGGTVHDRPDRPVGADRQRVAAHRRSGQRAGQRDPAQPRVDGIRVGDAHGLRVILRLLRTQHEGGQRPLWRRAALGRLEDDARGGGLLVGAEADRERGLQRREQARPGGQRHVRTHRDDRPGLLLHLAHQRTYPNATFVADGSRPPPGPLLARWTLTGTESGTDPWSWSQSSASCGDTGSW